MKYEDLRCVADCPGGHLLLVRIDSVASPSENRLRGRDHLYTAGLTSRGILTPTCSPAEGISSPDSLLHKTWEQSCSPPQNYSEVTETSLATTESYEVSRWLLNTKTVVFGSWLDTLMADFVVFRGMR